MLSSFNFYQRADQMTFVNASNLDETCHLRSTDKFQKPFLPVTLYKDDIQKLINFARKTSKKMLFGLNLNSRSKDGSWNSTNVELLLDFFKEQNFFPDFELGNEPNSYLHHFNYTMTPEQQANDFNELKLILERRGFYSSKLIGPSTTGRGPTALNYFSKFLETNPPVEFAAYHHYTLNGRNATVKEFMSPSSFYEMAY